MRDDRSNKLRAVYLAAIMVLSMVALSATFAGGAAAANIQDGSGNVPDDQERTSAEDLTISSGQTILDGVPRNGNSLSDSPLYNANLTGQHFGHVGLPTQEPEYDNSSLNYQQSRGGQVGTNPSQTINISFNIVAPEDESIDTEEVSIDYTQAGDLGMQINQSATDNLTDQINDEVPHDGHLDADGDENEIVNAEIDNATNQIKIEYEPTETAAVTDLELSVVWEPEDPVEGIDIDDGSMTTNSHVLYAATGSEDDEYRVAEAGATGITPGDTDAGGDVIDNSSATPDNTADSLDLTSSDENGSSVASTDAQSFEVWAQQGQTITFLPNGTDSRVQIHEVSTYQDENEDYYELGSQVASQTPAPGQAVTWNVDDLGLEPGKQYFVRFPDDSGDDRVAILDVNDLRLSAEVEDSYSIDEEITIDVFSEANSDDIEAHAWEADDFDGLDSETGTIIDVETDTTDGTGASTIRLDAESDLDAEVGDSFVVAVQHTNSGAITATSAFEVARTVDSVDTVDIDADFVGIVEDDRTVTVTASGFEDDEGAQIGDGRRVTVEIAGEAVNTDRISEGSIEVEVDPTRIDSTAETGTATVEIAEADGDSDTVDLVHEVRDLEEGYNLESIPQAATLHEQDIASVNQWDATEETYESGLDDGVLDSAEDLHHGLYVDAESDDARLGYEFETDDVPPPGDVELANGWHLASSNFAIYTQDGEIDIDTDLKNVEVDDPGITVDTPNFEGEMETVGAFDSYWIYVDDPDQNHRGIEDPDYDPDDRANMTDS